MLNHEHITGAARASVLLRNAVLVVRPLTAGFLIVRPPTAGSLIVLLLIPTTKVEVLEQLDDWCSAEQGQGGLAPELMLPLGLSPKVTEGGVSGVMKGGLPVTPAVTAMREHSVRKAV